jgi:hypothetical protein
MTMTDVPGITDQDPNPQERKPYVCRWWVEDNLYDYDARFTPAEAEVVREELAKNSDIYDVQIFEWGGTPMFGAVAMLEEIHSLFEVDDATD